MERTCAFALEIQDIWQFYTEAYNVGFLFLFALAWHSVSFLFGFRSPFFSPLSLCWYGSYLNSWAHNIKLLPKWTFVSDFEFGFTSAFPVMSLSKSTKLLLAHTHADGDRGKKKVSDFDFPSIQSMCNSFSVCCVSCSILSHLLVQCCCVYQMLRVYSIHNWTKKRTGITTVHQIIDCAEQMWNDGA